jgi:hypothetical protein
MSDSVLKAKINQNLWSKSFPRSCKPSRDYSLSKVAYHTDSAGIIFILVKEQIPGAFPLCHLPKIL